MPSARPEDDHPGAGQEGYEVPHRRPEHIIDEANVLTETEEGKVVDLLSLRAPAIYAIIKEEGEGELARPTASLFWSGLVAGISMGFSVLTLALMQMHLPDAEWTPLIASFGYAAGFLIVIFGRQQLFTESTITAFLPVLAKLSWASIWQLLRVWSVVLLANWIGCVLIALAFVIFPLIPADIGVAILDVSRHYADLSAGTAFFHAIGAGFLVATMVWMMPGAEGYKFALITFTAWLIALAGFTHVVAGMVEIAALVLVGELSAGYAVLNLALPTLAGNILGGTGLFALLAYATVKNEVYREE